MANTEVERHTGVDVEEVPSAKWGWSWVNPRTVQIAGLVAVVFLVAQMHGNHTGRVEDVFVLAFAALLLVFIVRDWWGRRRGWIR